HILQEIEFYKGKPVLYSIGNFVFGTKTKGDQQGVAAAFKLSDKNISSMDLIPLKVQNHRVDFVPRPFSVDEKSPLESFIDAKGPCKLFDKSLQSYRCELPSS